MLEHEVSYLSTNCSQVCLIDSSRPSKPSFAVTLNASTTAPNPHDSNPITYLQFAKPYGLTILDATTPQPTRGSRYRTTLKVFQRSAQKQCQLPRIEYVPDPEDESTAHAHPNSPVATCSSDTLAVDWSSNDPSRGAYCLLHIRFLPATGIEGSPNTVLVTLKAQTEISTLPHKSQLSNSGFETCHAVIQLSIDQKAAPTLLADFEHIQGRAESLQSLIKQVELDTTNLRKAQGPSSSHESSTALTNQHDAASKYQELEQIRQKLGTLRSQLSYVRPVTIFRQSLAGQAESRVDSDGDFNGGTKAHLVPQTELNLEHSSCTPLKREECPTTQREGQKLDLALLDVSILTLVRSMLLRSREPRLVLPSNLYSRTNIGRSRSWGSSKVY